MTDFIFNLQRFAFIENRNLTSVTGTDEADSIVSWWYQNVTITAGAGNDTIKNYGSDAWIFGNTGDDYIWNTTGQS